MVNLFRRAPAEPGSLTAALLALLEHSDRDLLNGFLRRAGIGAQLERGADLTVQFPAPDGPPTAGLISAPHLSLTLVTQAPGERLDPSSAADSSGSLLAVTVAGRAPEGAAALSWEQVDRWLAGACEQYDPESRTGFLLRQFRAYLSESGIEYFTGFPPEQLDEVPGAFAALTRFYQTADQFFDRFAPALTTLREGVVQARQARPEDRLAGYCYRDYTGAPFGAGGFLRLAFNLPQRELQLSLWLIPGAPADSHARLREALTRDPEFPERLRQLEHDPLLWLWSTAGERKLPLEELRPADIAELDWAQYQVGVQLSQPFANLAGEGLVQRVAESAGDLLTVLSPILTPQLH
jgi:hypothetical protein